MRIDTERIKATADLVDLAGRSVQLRKIAAGEYAGPCPKCGGTDRLHVQSAWFFCRQCWPADNGQGHDVIAWLMWREGLSFIEACARLDGGAMASAPSLVRRAPDPEPAPPAPPGHVWQAKAREIIETAEHTLWNDRRAAPALAYLRTRGFSDETIKAAHLGCVIEARRDSRTIWGLPPDAERPWLLIPRGIVLPCTVDGSIWYVKIRRPDRDVNEACKRYHALAGSRRTLYGADLQSGCLDSLMLVEGELNALSVWQAAKAAGLPSLDVLSFGSESHAGGCLAPELAGKYRHVIVWADEPERTRAAMATIAGAQGLRSIKRGGVKYDANAMLEAGALADFLGQILARLDLPQLRDCEVAV